MLSRCHIKRSSGLHDSGVRQDDTPTRSLIVTRWISLNLAQPHRNEHTIRQFTQKCHPSRLTHLSKISYFSIPHTHTFSFYKTSCTMFEVLSVLAAINVRTDHIQTLIQVVKEWLSQIKGWLSNYFFMQANHMQFVKQANRLCL